MKNLDRFSLKERVSGFVWMLPLRPGCCSCSSVRTGFVILEAEGRGLGVWSVNGSVSLVQGRLVSTEGGLFFFLPVSGPSVKDMKPRAAVDTLLPSLSHFLLLSFSLSISLSPSLSHCRSLTLSLPPSLPLFLPPFLPPVPNYPTE